MRGGEPGQVYVTSGRPGRIRLSEWSRSALGARQQASQSAELLVDRMDARAGECGAIPASDQAKLVDPDVLSADAVLSAVAVVGIQELVQTAIDLEGLLDSPRDDREVIGRITTLRRTPSR